ncbi:MAG: neutral/alkaline non-lysosomal ceramidase N-terminal domain-containing protein [Phycisphaerae bacterium]
MRFIAAAIAMILLFMSPVPVFAQPTNEADDKETDTVTLRAGFAGVDITPSEPCMMMGYGFRQDKLQHGHSGVRDPLHARVVVLNDGEQPAVIVSCDLCVLPTELATSIRQSIAERIETDADRVMLATTHTHSGPAALDEKTAVRWGLMSEGDEPSAEVRYAEDLREKLCSAAARAAGLTFPVSVEVREAPLGLAYDRRVMTEDGVKHCWGPQEWPDREPDTAHDITCTVLMLRQTNGPRKTILWSFGAHPVVLGKTSRVISADYAGAACRLIDERIDGANSMFLLGAAGDSHPWIATQEDPDAVDAVGAAAGSFVAVLSQALRPTGSELRIAAETVTIADTELPLAVWRLGDVYVVASPVEMFGELGVMLRKRLDGPVLMATLANGWEGYWPTEQAFEEGGYEVEGARGRGLSAGDGEKLIDELVRLAETLQ